MLERVRDTFRRRIAALSLALLCGGLLAVAGGADSPVNTASESSAPITKGQRVFTAGHSFHNFIYPMLIDMAQSAGIKDHQGVGTSRIGGSRVIQHWDVPEEKNACKAALRAARWTCSPSRRSGCPMRALKSWPGSAWNITRKFASPSRNTGSPTTPTIRFIRWKPG